MGTGIDFTQRYAADPATVRAMLTDPDYARMRGERTGSTSVTVEAHADDDGSARLQIHRVMPANVPSFAKAFVGETLTVTEQQHWGAPAPDGTGTATTSASFSAPITFTGGMAVEADGDGTLVRNTGTFTASVPFVAGKVEQVAREIFEKYLSKEQRLAEEWLAGR